MQITQTLEILIQWIHNPRNLNFIIISFPLMLLMHVVLGQDVEEH